MPDRSMVSEQEDDDRHVYILRLPCQDRQRQLDIDVMRLADNSRLA